MNVEEILTEVEPTHDPGAPAEDEPRDRRAWWARSLDVFVVVLLAVSSLLAAWAGHQSALWNGAASDAVTRASASQFDATRLTGAGYQLQQVDVALFLDWLTASREGDRELARFYEDRFPATLRSAFDAWQAADATDGPWPTGDPFRRPEYRVPQFEQAAAAERAAAAAIAESSAASVVAENYVLSTILIAIVLFFGGVSANTGWLPARASLLVVALALLAFVVAKLGGLPDASTWHLTPFWGEI